MMVPGQHLNIDMILQEKHTHFYIPFFLSSVSPKASLYLYSVSVNRLTHVFSNKISEYFIMKRYYVYIIIDIIFSICFMLHCIIIIWSDYTLATCSRILVMGSTLYFFRLFVCFFCWTGQADSDFINYEGKVSGTNFYLLFLGVFWQAYR